MRQAVPPFVRKHRAWRLGASLIRIYLLYAAAAFVLQRHLVFPSVLVADARPAPVGTEKVWLDVDGDSVEAWFVGGSANSTQRRPAILYAHGNGQLIDHAVSSIQPAIGMGYAVLLVEYPGYGRSEGSTSRGRILEAFKAGYDWLTAREEIDPARITFMGHSMGGAVACDLTSFRSAERLVLASTFTDLPSMFAKFLLPPFVVRDPFDCATALKSYDGKVLILHGEDDDVIPFEHGRALSRIAPAALFKPLQCRHNDCFSTRVGLWGHVERFFIGKKTERPPKPDRRSSSQPSAQQDAED